MLVIVGCALVAMILRIDEGRFLAAMLCFTAGPIFGAVMQRWWGGSGVLGAVIGGIVSYVGFGVVMHLRAYLSPMGLATQLIGRADAFFLLAVWGALVGQVVGALVCVVMTIAGSWRNP
jgi:hypothetical protein